MRIILIFITLPFLAPLTGAAAGHVSLGERFEPGHVSAVDVTVKLSGKLAVPTEKGKPPPRRSQRH